MNRIPWNRIISRSCLRIYSTRISNCSTKSTKIDEITNKEEPPKLPENECCKDCCANCVWLTYVTEVKFYYNHDSEKIKKAMDSIPHPEVKAFIELDMRLKEEGGF